MKHISQTLISIALVIGCLSGCQKAHIEDEPSEKAQAVLVAKNYLKAYIQADINKALEMSSLPFWADGEVFRDMDLFKTGLKKELSHNHHETLEILDARFYTVADLKLFNHKLWRKLNKEGMLTDIYLVALAVQISGDRDSEVGFILMRQEKGMWKVAGIGD